MHVTGLTRRITIQLVGFRRSIVLRLRLLLGHHLQRWAVPQLLPQVVVRPPGSDRQLRLLNRLPEQFLLHWQQGPLAGPSQARFHFQARPVRQYLASYARYWHHWHH